MRESVISKQQTDAAGKEAHARSVRQGVFANGTYGFGIGLSMFRPVAGIWPVRLVALV
jgi:hypothetical protein